MFLQELCLIHVYSLAFMFQFLRFGAHYCARSLKEQSNSPLNSFLNTHNIFHCIDTIYMWSLVRSHVSLWDLISEMFCNYSIDTILRASSSH